MDWEFSILNYIQNNIRNDWLDMIMPVISMLGTAGALWIVMALGSLFFKKTREFGKTLTFTLLFDVIPCLFTFKPIVNRIRPYDLNSTVQLIVRPEIDASFPSGHTFFAFSAATICFIYNKKLGVCMYCLAAMIALSRLYLYVHFPTDVICGAVFGILSSIAAYYMEKLILKKKPVLKNATGVSVVDDGE